MASTVRQKSMGDYFTRPAPRLDQNNTITTYGWDTSPYSDPAVINSDSCDSTLPSPNSPDSLVFPPTSYTLSKEEFGKNDTSFNFGTFEDWMRWDDPSDAALSPTSDFFPELKIEPVSPTMSGLELQGSGVGSQGMSDDTAVFNDDAVTEEPLFQTTSPLVSAPITDMPRESLYSTPLAWSPPTSGSRRSNSYIDNVVLSPSQESKLRSIAMPSQAYPTSPSSASGDESQNGTRQSRKRKSSVEDDEEEDGSPPPSNSRHQPIKKTAHNMIEKRYRTNLNDKIAALRDSVPSLRVVSKKNSRGEDVQEDLQGLTPAHKLNKATVLSKATEYIAHLEKRNRFLMKENSSLKSRVDAFEILVMSRQQQQQQTQKVQQQQQPQRPQSKPWGPDMGQMRGFGGLERMM